MYRQTVMWTALPYGTRETPAGTVYRLSVFVAPHLESDMNTPTTLVSYPDWVNWPAQLNATQFSVRFNGGAPVSAKVVSAPAESAIWEALFSGATSVKPYKFTDITNRMVLAPITRAVHSILKQHYMDTAAQSPAAPPPVATLGRALGPIASVDVRGGSRARIMADEVKRIGQAGAIAPDANMTPAQHFNLVRQVHEPMLKYDPVKREYIRPPLPTRAQLRDQVDFHQIITSLGHFPRLMRTLGLVVDLEVTLPAAPAPQGTLLVSAAWKPKLNPGMSPDPKSPPKTAYALKPRFMAAPKPGSDLANGFLDLSGQAYDVVQIDVDGTASKLGALADSLVLAASHKTLDTPTQQGLPALRSAGLSVAQNGRALRLSQEFAAAKTLDTAAKAPGNDVTLYADDLSRGYRVDVWDSVTKAWRSLCRRNGSYSFTHTSAMREIDDEEGFVASGVTESPDGSTDDLHTTESLFRWTGWSLSVPRPNMAVKTDVTQPDPVGYVQNQPVSQAGLVTGFKVVPGSLPRLRFGWSYRLRARMVDLAGNSLTLPDATDSWGQKPDPSVQTPAGFDGATNAAAYLRFDPLLPPAIVLHDKPGEGESALRLVIRSNYQVSAEQWAANHPGHNYFGYSERHIAPPKTTELTAEELGKFDNAIGTGKSAGAVSDAYTLAKIDGSFSANGVEPNDNLRLPYLPDPLTTGALFRGLPGAAVFPQKYAVNGDWPNLAPFMIRIVERTGPPTAPVFNNGVLTVGLAQAEVHVVNVSSILAPGSGPVLGISQWVQESLATNKLQIAQSIMDNTHWMVTPPREIMLVHAVQKPLLCPDMRKVAPRRGLGSTYATFDGTIPIHGESTIKLDVYGHWQEPVDDPADPNGPRLVGTPDAPTFNDHAFEVPIRFGQRPGASLPNGMYRTADHLLEFNTDIHPKHEFHNTKYRQVTYHAVATTRFRDYFPASITADRTNITRQTGVDPDTAIPDVVLNIPNAARPNAPKLLYVIPSFQWITPNKLPANAVGRHERLGSLRVYMDRPWFSSGDGELLGVVMWDRPATGFRPGMMAMSNDVPDSLKPYVTRWGNDPIWASRPAKLLPALADFINPAATQTGTLLEEIPGANVSVAGYKPSYDEDRQLWYCDIDLDPGPAYTPFIRLALARFQPISVEGAYISRVVLADFVQLAAARAATVIRDPGNPRLLNVSILGISPLEGIAGKNEVAIVLEESDAGGDQDLSWTPVPDTFKVLQMVQQPDGGTLWTGQVTLPAGGAKYRLLIQEFERFAGEAATISAVFPARLVYADTIMVSENG